MGLLVYSPDDGKHRIETDVTEPELAAIGRVEVLWSELEHCLLYVTRQLAGDDPLDMPDDATALSFKRRVSAYRELIRAKVTDAKQREALLALAKNLSALAASRHRVTHGLWDWEYAKPEALRASSFRAPYTFTERFDFNKLIKLGTRIGEVVFAVRFPGGWEEAENATLRERVQFGPYVSRKFALEMRGRDPENPHRRVCKPEPSPDAQPWRTVPWIGASGK
jgi:hypothetical protein